MTMRAGGKQSFQRGFTLVEIMVALTISLILVGGVIQLYASHRESYRNQEALSRLQENARFALATLVEEIAPGGSMGCLSDTAPVTNILSKKNEARYDFASAIDGDDGVDANGVEQDTLRVRSAALSVDSPSLQVVEAPAGQQPTAEQAANGTADVWLDSAAPGYSELQQYDVLVLADCEAVAVFMVTNDPAGGNGRISHGEGVVAAGHPSNDGLANDDGQGTDGALEHAFGRSTGSVATAVVATTTVFDIQDNVQNMPSLYMDGEEVVEGVTSMSVLYGVDVGGATRYADATTLDNTASLEWNNVVSVRVTLTISSVQNFTAGAPLTKDVTTTINLRNRV